MPTLEAALLPRWLRVEAITATAEAIVVRARVTEDGARCPDCGYLATRAQSHYVRTLGDVPWAGRRVRLRVTIRRFRCATADCPRRIFAERLGDFALPYARRTARAEAMLEAVAFALGGEAGARLAAGLGQPTSPDTLLRLIRRAPEPATPPVRVCGVDDFAWRKRRRYGTVLVDLERHQIIDLLPDRSAASVAAWFAQHPDITVVSRGRAPGDAAGDPGGGPLPPAGAPFHPALDPRSRREGF